MTLFNRTDSGGRKAKLRALSLFAVLSFFVSFWVQADTTDTASKFDQGLQQLVESGFSKTEQAVELISTSGDERAIDVLTLLLGGDLYQIKADHVLVTIHGKDGRDYIVAPLFSTDSSEQQTLSKRKIKKIAINNNLRRSIKSSLAGLSLSSPKAEVRLKAISQLMGSMDEDSYALLSQKLKDEEDSDVADLGNTALAIFDLKNSHDEKVQAAAIETLGTSYQPDARNALSLFINAHADSSLVLAAKKSLGLIEQRENVADWVQTLFFGLSLGSVLVLAAIGLAITFGVMGVINMAHGELIMLGAYTTYVVQTLMPNHIGLSIFVSIPLAFIVSGLVGIAIERGVMRFLYGRPLETLLATFGISLVLQQAVRTIFSPLNRSVSTPEWMQGVIHLNPMLSLTLNRLYIIVFCLIVFAILFMILKYTRLGIEVRAVSQNRSMARAMGVKSEWVDAMTFGLGSGIAGIAGVALSQLTNVGPNLGQAYIIDSFMVVVFGGVGNLWGTLVAGMSLGIANKVMEPWAGAVLAKILVLVFIILFIQKKPRGLFPQKGRSAEG
ncbi:urea ABC transporter permease subunit UrtB [Vibrio viridaestus]|uniref:Urea ABC transporter permease subunit UrtB n=1 Tax=Vibrio viridaestus TaxID=2487322 RepID=A0A3N9THK4_9VIBR|nr:urea ABC transporter permease subunit UrtB [Vibrio viridaestus]RQW63510.1 urea ABC transporter permease subunit UrtB [Vibrio viridaestus]